MSIQERIRQAQDAVINAGPQLSRARAEALLILLDDLQTANPAEADRVLRDRFST